MVDLLIRVLGIIGSPRKGGNTEIMVNEALMEAKKCGAEVEKMRIAEMNIKPCDGCLICAETKKCIIDDDLMPVFDKMVQADGIIIASPVYFGSVTPQVKALIDRVGYYNNHAFENTKFTGKMGGAIVVGERSGFLTAWTQILQFMLAERMVVPGVRWVYGIGDSPGDVLNDRTGLDRARDLGKTMVELAKKLKAPF